ncbi:MAG TPA: glycosyltransferase family 2 protein [Elusimicrobiota bacterium]|nr:glycosyltransferase family 2 protein [Elusimicrobiota bacterium]
MTSNQLISIIIVNYNGKRWLKTCLDSVLAQTYKNIEIILVDNASSDDSVAFVSGAYPQVQIVRNPENHGFGKANNIGAARARGDVLFLLNNDTKSELDLLERLLQFKVERRLSIVGPKILDYEGKDIYEGKKVTIDVTGYLGWGGHTFYIEGSAFMISKADFNKLRGFDEKYFMYSEDIDLCWRALISGMTLGVCDTAMVSHYCGGTSAKSVVRSEEASDARHVIPVFRRYEAEKNNLRNLLKNYSWMNLLWAVPLALFFVFGESVFYLFTRNFRMCGMIWKSVLWNVLNIGDTWRERRLVQGGRTVGDGLILKMMNFKPNKVRALLHVGIPEFK